MPSRIQVYIKTDIYILQRWFLAEILKVSSISPLDLVRLIQEKHIAPNWVEMLIPNGRSESQH